jgi:alanine racemase
MNRLGLSEAEYRALLQEGDTFAGLDIVHVMSHLACADTPQNEMNRRQLQRFTTWRRDFPTARASLANSAASLTHADYHFDMVRVGIALYGGNPFTHLPNPMRPVATLRARLLQCRNVKPYETIGYGATYTAPGDIVIATAGIGYGDGYPRVLGNKGLGYLETGYARLVGRVSMDSITLDVSALPREVYAPGRWVELMGPHVGVDAMASLSGTISYDILTGFTARVAREYVTAQQDSAENGGGQ